MPAAALQSPADAVAAVATIDFVPTVLRLACEMTGMGWSAVAHVGDEWWTACMRHSRAKVWKARCCQYERKSASTVKATICHPISIRPTSIAGFQPTSPSLTT